MVLVHVYLCSALQTPESSLADVVTNLVQGLIGQSVQGQGECVRLKAAV